LDVVSETTPVESTIRIDLVPTFSPFLPPSHFTNPPPFLVPPPHLQSSSFQSPFLHPFFLASLPAPRSPPPSDNSLLSPPTACSRSPSYLRSCSHPFPTPRLSRAPPPRPHPPPCPPFPSSYFLNGVRPRRESRCALTAAASRAAAPRDRRRLIRSAPEAAAGDRAEADETGREGTTHVAGPPDLFV